MPRVFAVYNKLNKLEAFRYQIGSQGGEVPIKFLRISELKDLESLLKAAYNEGQNNPSR